MSELAHTTAPPPWQLQLPDRASIVVGELAEPGHWLHFASERLVFDLERGLRVRDDGSASAASNIVDLRRFQLDYIGNGELHFYDADTRALLSRVDAFLPVNYMANQEWFESEIAKWLEILDHRVKLDSPN